MQKKQVRKLSIIDNENMTLKNGFDMFQAVNEAKNLSAETLEYYVRCYNSFAKYYGEDSLSSEIYKDTILNYIIHLKSLNITRLRDIARHIWPSMRASLPCTGRHRLHFAACLTVGGSQKWTH